MNRRYLALLRGVNVGGNNIIKMAELRKCFESLGLTDVSTYINSGNVLFSVKKTMAKEALVRKIEKAIAGTFRLSIKVMIISANELRTVVKSAPKGFGSDPARYRYDAIFLLPPLSAKKAGEDLPLKEGVDQVWLGRGVLYFSRLAEKATQSKLSRVIMLPVYKSMTIRNWNTTTRLAQLCLKG